MILKPKMPKRGGSGPYSLWTPEEKEDGQPISLKYQTVPIIVTGLESAEEYVRQKRKQLARSLRNTKKLLSRDLYADGKSKKKS